ncbi:prolactin-like [Castor canadensis]
MTTTMDSKQSSWKGSLLLLLVLNLLLCKNVAASPACAGGAANCRLSLQDLFTRAVALSDNIYKVAEDTFRDFQKTYATGQEFISRAINSCSTSSIPTPVDKDQALNNKVTLKPRFSTKTAEAAF